MQWKPLSTHTETDEDKGRTFTVHLVCALCPQRRDGTSSKPERPALLAYCGTSSQVESFTANLQLGKAAESGHTYFEILRSSDHRFHKVSPLAGETLVVAYLPELFHLNPGTRNESKIEFLLATPTWWIEREAEALAPRFGPVDAQELVQAADFVARLNTRTALPIANDLEFHRVLFQEARARGWLNPPQLYGRPSDLGVTDPLFCDVGAEEFRGFLADLTARELPQKPRAERSPIGAPAQIPFTFAA